MKKLLKSVLVLFVFVLFFNATTLPASATSVSYLEAYQWATDKIGKSIDYDGNYGAQCVDLIFAYCNYLGVNPYWGGSNNACDYASSPLPTGWQRITMTSGEIPHPGDIAVWKTNYSGWCEIGSYTTGWAGHIGIIDSADAGGFNAINQNFNQKKYCTKNWFNIDGLACIIRPNFSNASVTVKESVTCKWRVTIAANNYITLYDSATTYTASIRCFNPKTEAFSLTCTERITLSDGSIRYKFISAENLTLYLPWNSSIMTVEEKHSYTDSLKNATCTAAGKLTQTCSSCGYTKTQSISALGHSYSSTYTVDKAATCTDAGSKSYHCTRCSATTGSTSIPATGHNWAYKPLQSFAATCTAKGSNFYSCTRCAQTKTESVAARGHNPVTTPKKVATCTATGSTEGSVCSRCSLVLNAATVIPKKAHSWGSWTVVKAATTSNEGLSQRKCQVCKETEDRILAKLVESHTHSFGAWSVKKTATCTENGEDTRRCSCGAVETTVTKATGHSLGGWAVKQEATAEAEGILANKCLHCSYEETTPMPKLPETMTEEEEKPEKTPDASETPSTEEEKEEDAAASAPEEEESSFPILPVILVAVGILFVGGGAIACLILFTKTKNK